MTLFTEFLITRVQTLIAAAKKSGTLVSAWDEIKHLLIEAKVAWIAQTPPEFVGVHPDNRSGTGVGGSEAHWHGFKIYKAGFSWSKAADATAFEVAPGQTHAQRKNDEMVSLSGGLIPKLSQLKLLSVGGGHTNTWLRAIKAGCRSAVPELADATGHLSVDKLTIDRASLREAIDKGLRWTVLHHECERVWPELVDFIQKALNTEVREQQSEIECMLSMHHACQEAVAKGVEPNWVEIQKAACHSQPPCSNWINTLCDYVQKNGANGELLVELNEFSRVYGCRESGSTRTLGSEFYAKLSSLSFGLVEKYPFVTNATIKTNLQSPANKISPDGMCRLLLPQHLNALTQSKNRKFVREAESLMTDARRLLKLLNFDTAKSVTSIGLLDVRCILFILHKGKECEGREFKSISEIAEACLCAEAWKRPP